MQSLHIHFFAGASAVGANSAPLRSNLPIDGEAAGFLVATTWLNSAPYLRAWVAKYREQVSCATNGANRRIDLKRFFHIFRHKHFEEVTQLAKKCAIRTLNMKRSCKQSMTLAMRSSHELFKAPTLASPEIAPQPDVD